MLLGFKTKFPNTTPTNFKEKILDGTKIHTIRAGNRWKPGMKIHYAIGVRTKNCDIFKIGQCISVQPIIMRYGLRNTIIEIMNGDKHSVTFFANTNEYMDALIKNDGFDNPYYFYQWFGLHDINCHFEGQIIHFTYFRY